MKKLAIGCAGLFLVACGPGAGLTSFPNALANEYCQFIYSCCTPADRANQANPLDILQEETTLNFDSESDCETKLGETAQISFQTYEASVDDKRMSYDQNAAQACLTAVANAISPGCNPNAFYAAVATAGGDCTTTLLFAGLVPSDGGCTMSADCAVANSTCVPATPDAGGVTVVTSAGTCAAPAALGAPCSTNGTTGACVTGSCCGASTATCVAYVAEGATCTLGCDTTPCDPSQDYCTTAGTCAALVATGGACQPTVYDGTDCQSGSCDPTTSLCLSATPDLEICTGNSDGI